MSRPQVHVRPRRRPSLDILPMGGCGFIGMNLTLYGLQGRWLAIDCGMAIRQDLPGTPLQIPDINPLKTQSITPEAIVITHGHEDHIGALTWLWPHWGCSILATPLASGLLQQRFEDKGLSTECIRSFQPGDSLELAGFRLRTLPVTHSIPESCALLLEAGSHRVLHTGDWKLDKAPLIGPTTSAARFRDIAPIDLVVGDSTSATTAGHSRSEGEVARTLDDYIARCEQRVVISCFASNLARILAIGRAAKRHHRRIALLGRAMERMVRLARRLGYFEDFPDIVPLHDIGYLPREEVLLIATGSQGEPRAALSRLAMAGHSAIELQADDSVIFSSRVIPGNEPAVKRLHAAFRQMGIQVFEEREHPGLHASGHPAHDELHQLYDWIRPRHLIPVHGEQAHQQAHAELAETRGIRVTHLPANGDWLHWDGQQLHLVKQLKPSEYLIQPHRNNRSGSRGSDLTIILPVQHEANHWQRRGRIILDSDNAHFIDETALSDWIDDTLAELQPKRAGELHVWLEPMLQTWIREHSRQIMRLDLNVMPLN